MSDLHLCPQAQKETKGKTGTQRKTGTGVPCPYAAGLKPGYTCSHYF